MTRIVSIVLLLVVALGAGSGLAWAAEAHEVRVETNGMEMPPTHDAEDVEVSDEVVFTAGSIADLMIPFSMAVGDHRCDSVSSLPPSRPPRG